MTAADTTGQLLLATRRLADPNFAGSVILLLQHDDDGALGVIINRPSELAVAEVLPRWADAVAEPRVLHVGGPVATDSALAVGVPGGTPPVSGYQAVPSGYGLVDLDADPDDLMPGLVGVRIFAGYAGWGAGQLEDEIAEGSWYVADATSVDVLHPRPDELWRGVMRRQPGELAYVVNLPADPTMN